MEETDRYRVMSRNRIKLSISIISHKHCWMIGSLLEDLRNFHHTFDLQVILTLNIPEEFEVPPHLNYTVIIIKNPFAKGFGENHNKAFQLSSGDFFVVLNPDLRLSKESTLRNFEGSIRHLNLKDRIIFAPSHFYNQVGQTSTQRRFFGPLMLFKRLIGLPELEIDRNFFWVSGAFMVFPRDWYSTLGGFDEGYFMYCEDLDICFRALGAGGVIDVFEGSVYHESARTSRRNFKYFLIHLKSIFRLFTRTKYLRYLLKGRND